MCHVIRSETRFVGCQSTLARLTPRAGLLANRLDECKYEFHGLVDPVLIVIISQHIDQGV